ncbi:MULTISPECIES: prepilin-type N-terminal cleavage/methylation domain-containing protein [unclassified Pseudomonas]|uniref:PulJ/GspJ family protein n=2 Tax=Pseudomonas TaxID=286 RepID=UPI002AC97E2B|nr:MULTISPECIES: prepilin-type N-terminal cleavage/methylation domain-containing protein [unclassified Pseudomonas]MEB0039927.1 prepilin-type N-terminal cleavage/methylation domain-containing protein [Pseudomonas sp. MH10]MEB0123915.1 prepilin-type N-terminal cleavage/methylation domain-containing protein [Pseudomonas sp. CCI1.2]WPX66123.1 prepilin-type N-terminal cleavage/methylation domain-containing protein [Pseudomonas sp. MH10]
MNRPALTRGFTLVELVLVIALSGVIVVVISTVFAHPLQGLMDQSRRGVLVEQAAGAMNRLTRDVRLAIPNSLRASADGQAVELMLIQSAARYRPNRTDTDGLRFSTDLKGTCGSSTLDTRCDEVQLLDGSVDTAGALWMVMYNIGAESGGVPVPGSNVWAPANPGVITPTGTTFTQLSGPPPGESLITLGNLPVGGFRFAYASPQYRMYMAQSVVGYRCENNQLIRYSYNTLYSAIPSVPPAGSNPEPLASNVDCSKTNFTYQVGSTQRGGLLSLTLQISIGNESFNLLQQVHVDNAP